MSQMNQVNSSVDFEDVRAGVVETRGVANFLPPIVLHDNLAALTACRVELIAALQRRFDIINYHYEVSAEVFRTFEDVSVFISADCTDTRSTGLLSLLAMFVRALARVVWLAVAPQCFLSEVPP